MADKKRILVVDDEPQITRVLRTALTGSGYEVRTAEDGHSGLRAAREWQPDLVITDVSMPNMSGIELCRQLRAESALPIIVLSVKGEEKTKVEALDAGADDYVTKPVGMDELLARVRRNLARTKPTEDASQRTIAIGDFKIDAGTFRVVLRNNEVRLTPKEFELLLYPGPARGPGGHASRPAACHLGPQQPGAAGTPARSGRTTPKENRFYRDAALHHHRALGRIPLRTDGRSLSSPLSASDRRAQA